MPKSDFFGAISQGLQFKDKMQQMELKRLQDIMKTDQMGLQAAFQDAAVMRDLLQRDPSGRSAMEFGVNRLEAGLSQGRDMIHTQQLLGEIRQDPVKAINSLDSFLSIPQEMQARAGQRQEPAKTAQQKNFEQLQELKEKGTPEQVATFEKMLNLTETAKLSSKAEKAMIDSQDAFIKAGEQARKMELLAQDVERTDIGGGLGSTVSETFKNLLGSQDEVSDIRRRFRAIRASQSVNNLPPGPASDKDIALALSGFPAENAPASQVISFLRGQAKLARIDEAFHEFKADYIGKNNKAVGLIPAWKRQLNNDEFIKGIIKPADRLLKTQDINQLSDDDLLSF